MVDEDQLYGEMSRLVKGLGLDLLDLRSQMLKGTLQCQMIICRDSGVGTEHCVKVYRAALPRLELLCETQDIHLEVSSPGLDRKIRLWREYPFFVGKFFVFYMENKQEISGKLLEVHEDSLTIRNAEATFDIKRTDIVRAKLDGTREVATWEQA